MDLALANTIQGIAHYIREMAPDMIVVHGDRVEALAGAVVGALSNVLVAHIEGGEVSGPVEEQIRHSVNKLSHLHFVANSEFAKLLAQLAYNRERVYTNWPPDTESRLPSWLPIH